jgi:K(+)-stimulated pyrophosphate-energized sodium pump
MLPETMQMNFFGEGLQDISSIRVFYACLVGLVVGAGISAFTEYYTGLGKAPILKLFSSLVLELELILLPD